MRKYHSRPRRSRSDAQKAHALSLTASRIQCQKANSMVEELGDRPNKSLSINQSHENRVDTGPIESSQVVQLKQELNWTKRKLKNTSQREKRAKATLAQQDAELSRLHCELMENEQRASSTTEELNKATTNAEKEITALQRTSDFWESQATQASNQLSQQLEGEKLAKYQAEIRLQDTQDRMSIADLTILDTTAQLASNQQKLEHLEFRNSCLEQKQDIAQKKLTRARVRLENMDSAPAIDSETHLHCLALKNPSGVIRPEVRDLLRQLAGDGVATEKIMDVIHHVTTTFNLTLADSISARSVSRAVLEGLIQSRIQIAVEIDNAECLSICGDGTTIKNQTYEARLLHAPTCTTPAVPDHPPPAAPPLRTLGVSQAPNHTAQSQLDGWKEAIANCCDLFRRSPMGQCSSVDNRSFASKLGGMLTDHASDQKRLVDLMIQWKTQSDRELRGQEVLDRMSIEARAQALLEHLEEVKKSVANWELLPPDEEEQFTHRAWSALALSTGEEAFSQLPGSEKELITFFAWTGCCMHKELNAFKGGVKSMSTEWIKLKLTPPIELKNKYETQNTHSSRDRHGILGGAVKLTLLAGLVFNHRDDKRGHQDTYRFWFEEIIGYLPTFPDVSNTRYGSHGDAAVELLVNREHYIEFLERVRDAGRGKLANIEENIYNGLKDPATLTELAVTALYSQAVSKPYMRHVRGSQKNALELGNYHEKVKDHCRTITNNPHLLMASSTGTLDGNEWEQPKLIKKVNKLGKDIPHLYGMLTSFFGGALETWERFTQEFGPESMLGQVSSELRSRIWNNPTNDASEGALGQARQMTRNMPAITENQRNGRVMWEKNRTREFTKKNFSDDDHAFVRREARILDASGQAKRTRMKQTEAWKERGRRNKERRDKAQMRKSAHKHSLANVQIMVNPTHEQLSELTIRDLDKQIDKIRELNIPIPAKTRLRKKAEKIAAIQHALEGFTGSNDPRGATGEDIVDDTMVTAHLEDDSEEESVCLTGDEYVSDPRGGTLPVGAAEYDDAWEF